MGQYITVAHAAAKHSATIADTSSRAEQLELIEV